MSVWTNPQTEKMTNALLPKVLKSGLTWGGGLCLPKRWPVSHPHVWSRAARGKKEQQMASTNPLHSTLAAVCVYRSGNILVPPPTLHLLLLLLRFPIPVLKYSPYSSVSLFLTSPPPSPWRGGNKSKFCSEISGRSSSEMIKLGFPCMSCLIGNPGQKRQQQLPASQDLRAGSPLAKKEEVFLSLSLSRIPPLCSSPLCSVEEKEERGGEWWGISFP